MQQTVLARMKTQTCVTKFRAAAHANQAGKEQTVLTISMNVTIQQFVKLTQIVKTQMGPFLVIVMKDIL